MTNLITPQEAEKAANQYAKLLSECQSEQDKFKINIGYLAGWAAHSNQVIPALESCKSLLEMFVFRAFKEVSPKQRSFVIGASSVGYAVYEFKHGCFFIGLERHDDVHSWMPLPDAITSQLCQSTLAKLKELTSK